MKIWIILKRLVCEEIGQTLVEYGLILILVSLIAIFLLRGIGEKTNSMYSTINSSVTGLP